MTAINSIEELDQELRNLPSSKGEQRIQAEYFARALGFKSLKALNESGNCPTIVGKMLGNGFNSVNEIFSTMADSERERYNLIENKAERSLQWSAYLLYKHMNHTTGSKFDFNETFYNPVFVSEEEVWN